MYKIVKLKPETVEKLKKMGTKADSYDSLINKLIQEHEASNESLISS